MRLQLEHPWALLVHLVARVTRAAPASALLLSGALALALTACSRSAPPPALAAGERPVTGEPRYDRFFAELADALAAEREARAEEAEARRALARRLGLSEGVPFEVLGERARERAARLAADGLTLELEFTGLEGAEHTDGSGGVPSEGGEGTSPPGAAEPAAAEGAPTATLRTPGREPLPRELRLLEAVAQAALSSATVYTNMARVRADAERLLAREGELRAELPSAFPQRGSRERVRTKLDEAAALLPELGAHARELEGAAETLIAVLDEAANTAPVLARRRPGAPKAPASVEPLRLQRPRPAPAAPAASAAPESAESMP